MSRDPRDWSDEDLERELAALPHRPEDEPDEDARAFLARVREEQGLRRSWRSRLLARAAGLGPGAGALVSAGAASAGSGAAAPLAIAAWKLAVVVGIAAGGGFAVGAGGRALVGGGAEPPAGAEPSAEPGSSADAGSGSGLDVDGTADMEPIEIKEDSGADRSDLAAAAGYLADPVAPSPLGPVLPPAMLAPRPARRLRAASEPWGAQPAREPRRPHTVASALPPGSATATLGPGQPVPAPGEDAPAPRALDPRRRAAAATAGLVTPSRGAENHLSVGAGVFSAGRAWSAALPPAGPLLDLAWTQLGASRRPVRPMLRLSVSAAALVPPTGEDAQPPRPLVGGELGGGLALDGRGARLDLLWRMGGHVAAPDASGSQGLAWLDSGPAVGLALGPEAGPRVRVAGAAGASLLDLDDAGARLLPFWEAGLALEVPVQAGRRVKSEGKPARRRPR